VTRPVAPSAKYSTNPAPVHTAARWSAAAARVITDRCTGGAVAATSSRWTTTVPPRANTCQLDPSYAVATAVSAPRLPLAADRSTRTAAARRSATHRCAAFARSSSVCSEKRALRATTFAFRAPRIWNERWWRVPIGQTCR
jgi:hypothetical protein